MTKQQPTHEIYQYLTFNVTSTFDPCLGIDIYSWCGEHLCQVYSKSPTCMTKLQPGHKSVTDGQTNRPAQYYYTGRGLTTEVQCDIVSSQVKYMHI